MMTHLAGVNCLSYVSRCLRRRYTFRKASTCDLQCALPSIRTRLHALLEIIAHRLAAIDQSLASIGAVYRVAAKGSAGWVPCVRRARNAP